MASAISSLTVGLAQTTNVFLPSYFNGGEALAGEILGVGEDGTTLAVSNIGVTDTEAVQLFTATVVEDATHLSVLEIFTDDETGSSVTYSELCTFSSVGTSPTAIPARCMSVDLEVDGGVTRIASGTGSDTAIVTRIALSTVSDRDTLTDSSSISAAASTSAVTSAPSTSTSGSNAATATSASGAPQTTNAASSAAYTSAGRTANVVPLLWLVLMILFL